MFPQLGRCLIRLAFLFFFLAQAKGGQPTDLQALIDAAQPGSTIEIPAGEYLGPIVIAKSLTLVGAPGTAIHGNGKGNVVEIRADHVSVKGFHISQSGLDLGNDNAAVFVQGNFACVQENEIDRSLHGIYLKKVTDCRVIGNKIHGKHIAEAAKQAPNQSLQLKFGPDGNENCDATTGKDQPGNGIHLWNCDRILVRGNEIKEMRDGIYFSFTHHSQVIANSATHLRFGLHYMYSDYNVFEKNVFSENAAGGVLMYSKSLLIRDNTFSKNVGHRSYGLVMIAVDNTRLEHNRLEANSIGIFLELSNNNVLLGNLFQQGYIGARLTGSSDGNKFSRNSFAGNLHPVEIEENVGDNSWAINGVGNYWGTAEVDLHGKGIGDFPHRETDLLGALRRPFPFVALLSGSPSLDLVRFAEQHAAIPGVPAIIDPAPLTAQPN